MRGDWPVVFEINPRFSGGIPLTIAAGADFPQDARQAGARAARSTPAGRRVPRRTLDDQLRGVGLPRTNRICGCRCASHACSSGRSHDADPRRHHPPGPLRHPRVCRARRWRAIGGRTVLEHCLRRLMFAGVARVVLATTRRRGRRAGIVARRLGADVFRGSTRPTCSAATEAPRMPSGSMSWSAPPATIRAWTSRRQAGCLRACARGGADYACEDGLPYGAARRGRDARRARASRAQGRITTSDREHVTTFVRRNTQMFKRTRELRAGAAAAAGCAADGGYHRDLDHVRELLCPHGPRHAVAPPAD